MKKFLTVLLALSVVFTYSFGTVFAGTGSDELKAKLSQAEGQLMSELNSSATNVTGLLQDYTVDSYKIETAQWAKAVSKAVEVIAADITTSTAAIDDSTNDALTVPQLVALYKGSIDVGTSGILAKMYGGSPDASVQTVAAKAQFAVDKAAYVDGAASKIAKIDLSVYSTDKKATTIGAFNGVDYYSYYEMAKAITDKLTADINAVVIDDTADDTVAKVYAKTLSMATFFTDAVNTTGSGDTAVYTLKNTSLKTKAVEDKEALTGEAAKSALLASVASEVSAYYKTFVDSADYSGDYTTKVKAEMDAYQTAWTYLINNVTGTSSVNAHSAWTSASAYAYSANAAQLAEGIKLAEKYRAWKDENGNAKYDSTAIDKVIEVAKAAAYGSEAVTWTLTSTFDAGYGSKNFKGNIEACEVKTDAVTDYQKAAAKKYIDTALKTVLVTGFNDNYYAPEAAAITALYDALKAKVDAATTLTELKKVVTFADTTYVTVIALVNTPTIPATVKTKIQVKSDIASEVPTANLVAYAKYLNGSLLTTDKAYRNFVTAGMMVDTNTLVADFWQDFYAEKGARKASDVANYMNDATAAMDAVPTVEALAAGKASLEAIINGIPATVTLADKETIANAYKAYVDRPAGVNPSNMYKLNLAIKAVAALEKAAVEKTLTDTVKLEVSVANKAAYLAAKAALDAFNEACDDTDNMYKYQSVTKIAIGTGNGKTVTDAASTIKGLEKAAIEAAVKDLPFNITLADKAKVEAIRDAYTAYAAEYADANTYDPSVDMKDTLEALAKAEAEIAALEPTVNVKDVAGKATTKKVGKKVRVYFKNIPQEIKDLGDSAYIQVWKSKNAVKYNFSKRAKITAASTLISKTYNGKNYVKFRVVVVNEDGTKTFSPWSTVGCRIIKK